VDSASVKLVVRDRPSPELNRINSKSSAHTDLKHCSHCHGRLIEIDYYGQRILGCIECNCWGWPNDERLLMEMPDDDLEALRGARQTR
jgi:hypothetical protein